MGIWQVEDKGWRYQFEAFGKKYSKAWFRTKAEATKARDDHKEVLGFSKGKKVPCILKHYGEKHKARALFYHVFKQMDVEKPKTCRVCGKEKKLLAHHEDYTKPFKILWVCRGCHNSIHGNDKSTKMISAHGERVKQISQYFGVTITG